METPDVLKVLPTCRHAFCSRCLASHVQNRGAHSGNIPCPTCHCDCHLPEDEVEGLQDYDAVDETDTVLDSQHGPAVFRGQADLTRVKVAMCESCHYNKNPEVKAEKLCEECGSVYLCRDCALVHCKNKATSSHILISLKKTAKEWCKKHMKVMNRFCSTCSEPCCHLCILLGHGDHEIMGLAEVFNSLVDEVKNTSAEQSRRSNELKLCAGQLDIIKSSELADRKGVLIKEIEDHAEKCIERIIKEKESLKDQVEEKFKLFTLVSGNVEKAATIDRLDSTLVRTGAVLSAAVPTPKCVQKLVSVKQEMSKYGIGNKIDIDEYLKSYKKLQGNYVTFVPHATDCNIGALGEMRRRLLGDLTLTFERKLKVGDPGMFVPCVTVIDSDFYAVADPTVEGKLSNGFDIYKFPDVLQKTYKEHPESLIDMAACPGGYLAALSPGDTPSSCRVPIFHPTGGYQWRWQRQWIRFPIRNPLSFDVINNQRYVFLSNDGGRKVTICQGNGPVVLVHQIDESIGINDALRIASSRQFIYVIGRKRLAVYEWKDNNLVLAATSGNTFKDYELTDISVTDSDEVTFCYKQVGKADKFFLGRYVQGSSLSGFESLAIDHNATQTRLSARDGYVVTSQEGSTIRIYKEHA